MAFDLAQPPKPPAPMPKTSVSLCSGKSANATSLNGTMGGLLFLVRSSGNSIWRGAFAPRSVASCRNGFAQVDPPAAPTVCGRGQCTFLCSPPARHDHAPYPCVAKVGVDRRGGSATAQETSLAALGLGDMRWTLGSVAAAVLASGFPIPTAQAIPVAGHKVPPLWSASVSRAAPRHCRWQHGQRVCWVPRGDADWYEHDANKLPFGTERWRDQMRRENRLGNPG